MKTKSGEKRFFGIFKKKTTPAPVAPPPQVSENTNSSSVSIPTGEETTSLADSVTVPPDMPPRKGSIAQTSVIHYSPPGTVRASFPPSATSSVVSDGSEESSTVVITRKSNIMLDDEESVISTPVSQYDESPIVNKPRTKRVAPPPPAQLAPAQDPYIPSTPTSSSISPSSITKEDSNKNHYRQNSTNSISSTPPPPPPPHKNQKFDMDYEAMLKKLQMKFDEWHQVRLESGGSIKEERIKAEVLKEHEKLKLLLEKQINSDRPKHSSSNSNNNNNNNNVKKQLPLKIPQYGNFYSQPLSAPSPPTRVGAVPGGTVYQKTSKEKPSSISSTSSPVQVPIASPISPKMDENRNEVVPKKKISAPVSQNTEAVDRLRREVEEQRQREKEVKQYRNPKALEVQVKSPEPRRKQETQPPQSPQKSSPGPRMVEYKPMKSPGIPVETENVYVEIDDVAPPIPNTPPPKLAEYRKEQQTTAPRMPIVPTNGYVRLQMNGASKKQAPSAPGSTPIAQNSQKISQMSYTGPEYASSPKLLRKTPEPSKSTKIYASVPVKEEKKVYEKPQIHPQINNGGSVPKDISQNYQGGMITATSSSSSSHYRKNPSMTRGIFVDQNGYGHTTKVTVPNVTLPQRSVSADEKQGVPTTSSPVNYRKIVSASMTRTVSEDQNNYGYASKTTVNIATSPYTQRKTSPATPSPSNYQKSKVSPMSRAMSTDQDTGCMATSSPSNYRKISAPATTLITSPLKLSSSNATQSPAVNRKSQGSSGILSATSSKALITSATSPPYPKGSMGSTVISIKPTVPTAPISSKAMSSGGTFDISDVLKGPKLRKIGMPVERSGISLGKVVETETTNRPSSTPPPPPPPPPPPADLRSPASQQFAPKNSDLRDSLMSEIREAGRLRAARAAQTA